MRKVLVSLLVVASLGASSIAMAAPADTAGKIKALDAKACTVTLDNNTVYQFAAKCDFSKLTVGEKVKITADKTGNKEMATAIVAA